jgi:DNA-binding NtrC family response regulator
MSNTLLLIDCNAHNNTGEQLEAMLASAGVGDQLKREVVVDPAQLTFEHVSLGANGDKAALIFLLLPSGYVEPGSALIHSIRKDQPDLPIIAVVDQLGATDTLELFRLGASDLITLPLRAGDTLPRVWRLLEQQERRKNVVHTLVERVRLKLMVGQAPNFLAEVKKIPLIARCDSRVLISGETGTGKEMCARAIHYLSPRKSGPFVSVNCGAIPTELVENELFGHERGAFTGANTSKQGLIQEAEAGTIFLDEIDCLPPMSQVKLLRFLQEKEYRRLGSSKIRHADVRVLAATNAPLEEALHSGRIRQDLYYRLNVFSISLPPLRERRSDIPTLAQHFITKYSTEDRTIRISTAALQKLIFYDWPGNVRELEHTIERAVMFCETGTLEESDMVLPVQRRWSQAESFQKAKAQVIEQFEKEYIQNLLLSHGGNISKAAQAANKNRRAFWELIRKHQVDVQTFKQHT